MNWANNTYQWGIFETNKRKKLKIMGTQEKLIRRTKYIRKYEYVSL